MLKSPDPHCQLRRQGFATWRCLKILVQSRRGAGSGPGHLLRLPAGHRGRRHLVRLIASLTTIKLRIDRWSTNDRVTAFASGLSPGATVGAGLFPVVSGQGSSKVLLNFGHDQVALPLRYQPPSADYIPVAKAAASSQARPLMPPLALQCPRVLPRHPRARRD